MSNKDLLDNIKKLREMTGVGFKDCKVALDETKGDIEKSIEFLRKKGIAKASNKMSRTASEGLCLVESRNNEISLIEINSETDFVAKNKEFISFCKEVSKINFDKKSNLEEIKKFKMISGQTVEDSLIDLIAKIGEKITLRRSIFFDNQNGINSFYIHNALEENIGKIVSIVRTSKSDNVDIGKKISMHISAMSPLALDKDSLDKKIIEKETEIIKAELTNSGKKPEMIVKISQGKINKFISDNTLINQVWILDSKKKVSDILKENSIKILDFVRYKVGEGI